MIGLAAVDEEVFADDAFLVDSNLADEYDVEEKLCDGYMVDVKFAGPGEDGTCGGDDRSCVGDRLMDILAVEDIAGEGRGAG